MKLVVVGGSGLIGSKLVAKLRVYGHEAVAASPDSGVNTLTGKGLAQRRGAGAYSPAAMPDRADRADLDSVTRS